VTHARKLWDGISIAYNNYFQRGSTRFSQIITYLTSLATFVTVYYGPQNLALYVAILGAIAVLGFTVFGYFDYGPHGTRLRETKKYWESDFGIAPALTTLRLLEKTIESQNAMARKLGIEPIELSESESEMIAWALMIEKRNKFGQMIHDDLLGR
jgi:hypothetical protein